MDIGRSVLGSNQPEPEDNYSAPSRCELCHQFVYAPVMPWPSQLHNQKEQAGFRSTAKELGLSFEKYLKLTVLYCMSLKFSSSINHF
jgi:hypothetical protein